MRQGDLFPKYEQGDLFEGFKREHVPYKPDLDDIRARLNAPLQELRTAESFPLSEADLRYWRVAFRQMPNWLPEQERIEIQEAFLEALERWGRRDE